MQVIFFFKSDLFTIKNLEYTFCQFFKSPVFNLCLQKNKRHKELTLRRGTSSSSSKERPTMSRWTVLVSKDAKFLIERPSIVISAVTPLSLIQTEIVILYNRQKYSRLTFKSRKYHNCGS